MASNDSKNKTLGMPYGTASNRLRKHLLFELLKRHGENTCVRCGETIERVDDLSVEHIKPWEGISAGLFWDLSNVAFSHLHCNRPHRNWGGAGRKIQAPEGQSWCFSCERFKQRDEFAIHSRRWNGVDAECKECKSKRNALRDRKVQSGVGLVVEQSVANA